MSVVELQTFFARLVFCSSAIVIDSSVSDRLTKLTATCTPLKKQRKRPECMHEYFNASSALPSARSSLRSTNVTNDRDVQRILFFNFFEFFRSPPSPPLFSHPSFYPIPRKSFRHATINAALSNARLVSFGEVEIHGKRREYIPWCSFVINSQAIFISRVIKSKKKKNFGIVSSPQNRRIYRQFRLFHSRENRVPFRCN